jgi:hypothetical protein
MMSEHVKEAIVWALMVVVVTVMVCAAVTVNKRAVKALDNIEHYNVEQYGGAPPTASVQGWTYEVIYVDGKSYVRQEPVTK